VCGGLPFDLTYSYWTMLLIADGVTLMSSLNLRNHE